jgi:hypothetical protein
LDASPVIRWQKTFSDTENDYAILSITKTNDGGFALIGNQGYYTNANIALIKTDALGNIQWTEIYNIGSPDETFSIEQTPDGGYFCVGNTWLDIFSNILILKTNQTGNLEWWKYFGVVTGGSDKGIGGFQTPDGGYLVAGRVPYLANGSAAIMKFNRSGVFEWYNLFGNDRNAFFYSAFNVGGSISKDEMKKTADGGYVIAAQAYDSTSTVHPYLLKLDNSGSKQWSKSYDILYYRDASAVIQTTDGGYLVVGETPGVGILLPSMSSDYYDFFAIKTDSQGNIVWNRTYNFQGWEQPYSLVETHDGGYIIVGAASGSMSTVNGSLILKVNSQGNELWHLALHNARSKAMTITTSQDGEYVVAGFKYNSSTGQNDGYLLKFFDNQESQNKIALKTPNGGESWKQASVHSINWTYSGTPGSYVKIVLVKGGKLSSFINNKTSIGSGGNGSFSWTIPSTQVSGSDFKVKVTSISNTSISDISDNTFTIQSGGGTSEGGMCSNDPAGKSNDEMSTMGVAPVVALIGDRQITSGFSLDGKMVSFFYPTVGAYDFVPYFTRENETKCPYGTPSHMGAFLGVVNLSKDTNNVHWLLDPDNSDGITHAKDMPAFTYSFPANESIKVNYTVLSPRLDGRSLQSVVYNVTVTNTGNRKTNVGIAYYALFDPAPVNQRPVIGGIFELLTGWQQLNGLPWISYRNGEMVWWKDTLIQGPQYFMGFTSDLPNENIRFVGMDYADPRAGIAGDLPLIGDGIYDTSYPHSDGPNPIIRRPALGCKPDGDCAGVVDTAWNGVIVYNVSVRPGETRDFKIGITAATSNTEIRDKFRILRTNSTEKLVTDTRSWWDKKFLSLLRNNNSIYKKMDSSEKDSMNWWVMTLGLMSDERTGAIVASPLLIPNYYGVWPRDGTFQSIVWNALGKTTTGVAAEDNTFRQISKNFIGYLTTISLWKTDHKWHQCYDSYKGDYVGLPLQVEAFNFPVGATIPEFGLVNGEILEEDQMGLVLMGIWDYNKTFGELPTSKKNITYLANYITGRIDQGYVSAGIEPENGYRTETLKLPTQPATTYETKIGLIKVSSDSYEFPGEVITGMNASNYQDKIQRALTFEPGKIAARQSHYTNFVNAEALLAAYNMTGNESYWVAGSLLKDRTNQVFYNKTGKYYEKAWDPWVRKFYTRPVDYSMDIAWPIQAYPITDQKFINHAYYLITNLNLVAPDSQYFTSGLLTVDIYQNLAKRPSQKNYLETQLIPNATRTYNGYLPEMVSATEFKPLPSAVPLGWTHANAIMTLLTEHGYRPPMMLEYKRPINFSIVSPTAKTPVSAGLSLVPKTVRVTAVVKDNNTPVSGLKKENFTVRIGGKKALHSIISTPEAGTYILNVFAPVQATAGYYNLSLLLDYKKVNILDLEKKTVRYTTTSKIGVYNSSTSMFFLRNGTVNTTFKFGSGTDIPVTGDWNGDGLWDVGVFRNSTRTFILKNGSMITTVTAASWYKTDIPVTGDWNGDGVWDVGVFRNSTRTFILRNGSRATTVTYGEETDIPVTGDWNGDGLWDVGVFRNASRMFILKNGSQTTTVTYGYRTDIPVTGDWNGDGLWDVGVFRPSASSFYLKNKTATTSVTFGRSTDIPVAGMWK